MNLGDLIALAVESGAEDWQEYQLMVGGLDVTGAEFDPDETGVAHLMLTPPEWTPLGFRELHGEAS
jgi:hypothetical protein